jgi:hypothetical protein
MAEWRDAIMTTSIAQTQIGTQKSHHLAQSRERLPAQAWRKCMTGLWR